MEKRKAIGERPNFRPKKSLGQHFLVDPGIITSIINSLSLKDPGPILEIGPGFGALTFPLAKLGLEVVAVEKDMELSRRLESKLSSSGIKNVTIVNQDILKFNFSDLNPSMSGKFQVIGNLPYNISSPFLEKLIDNRALLSRGILMFQREVAKRLTASPGVKAYGALTVLIQYYAEATPVLNVSKKAFRPVPKVDSAVLKLDFNKPYPKRATSEVFFKKVVKGAFSHRRKTLLNSLKGYGTSWGKEVLLAAMTECSIDPIRRAETLDMDEFLCLATALSLTN